MRNIFLFIRRYFNFLFFILLQIVALYMLFHYNRFHEAAFMGVANEITGGISGKYDNIAYYFNLKKTNEELVKENAELRNRLYSNFEAHDTSGTVIPDTLSRDTTGMPRKYLWMPAKVVYNSVNMPNNTLTINRGSNQGVFKDMGVICTEGVVGTVINTSPNYAIVMSLLHSQSRISAGLKKTGETGTVLWEGTSPLFLTMINIPKSVKVAVGDSVVTSQYTTYKFPKGIMIGTISEIIEDKGSNFYSLKVKPATNFYNVEYVTVVDNLQKEEQRKLEDSARKNQ